MPTLNTSVVPGKSCVEFDTDALLNQGVYDWGVSEAIIVFYRSETDTNSNDTVIFTQEFNGRNGLNLNSMNTGAHTYTIGTGGLVMPSSSTDVYINNTQTTTGNTLAWQIVDLFSQSGRGNRTGLQISGKNQDPSVNNNKDFEGYIGEILIFNSHLSSAQRSQIMAYLKIKWNIRF
jgi:hypothetical protein